MNVKTNLVIGVDAKGKQTVIYIGDDGQVAKDTYETALSESEFENVNLFLRLRPDRRGDVAKAKAQAKAADEFRAKEAKAKAEKEAAQPVQPVSETKGEEPVKPKKAKK